ncbi:MAG: hypothetical protein JW838_09850 [Spirochaetes bacterium]|nr:hypothetical protein [Spirochaetota bacterium]
MEILQDYKELLELFNKHKVEFIIVGSYALAHHGAPRYTGDIDLFVSPTEINARRILNALTDFGFGPLNLAIEDFSLPNKVVQLGVPPIRIDIITSISGVSWEEACSGKVEGMYGPIKVHFLGRDHYIKNKRSIGRKKDQADLEAIGTD